MIEYFDTRSIALGDNVTTEIQFDFLITKKADLQLSIIQSGVTPVIVDGNDTTYISDVTFDPIQGGGTVTLLAALVTGKTYYVDLNVVDPVQPNLFRNRSVYDLRGFESAIDYIVTQVQTLFRNSERSLRFKRHVDITAFSPFLPDPSAGYMYNDGTKFIYVAGINTETPSIVGTLATPESITAAGGIPFSGANWKNVIFVKGTGGVIITANPKIPAGTNIGQELTIIGTSDTDYVDIQDLTGVITGDQTIRLGSNSIATFFWNGLNWVIKSTNGLIPA